MENVLERNVQKMYEFIIKYWIEFVFGLAIAGLSLSYDYLRKKLKKQEAINEGVLALLHDRLYQSCMYYLNKGQIEISELKNIEKLYNAYHELGGNGTGTEVYERVKELKIIK